MAKKAGSESWVYLLAAVWDCMPLACSHVGTAWWSARHRIMICTVSFSWNVSLVSRINQTEHTSGMKGHRMGEPSRQLHVLRDGRLATSLRTRHRIVANNSVSCHLLVDYMLRIRSGALKARLSETTDEL